MRALAEWLDEFPDAIAYDLLQVGLRLRDLGSDELTWGDLRAMTTQAPRHSAFYRAMHPEEAVWGLPEQLLAALVDYSAVANWQRGSGKQRDYPKPIPRPGVESDEKKFGVTPVTQEEIDDFLGWNQHDE